MRRLNFFYCLLFPLALAAQEQAAVSVQVAEAVLRPVADRVEALGTLRADESVALSANVTETITAVHFEDGQRVEKGAVLVEMTSAEEHAQLSEARATVSEAKQQYDRVRSLVEQGAASRALLDQRKREYETARAQLEAVSSRMEDRVITAPFDGVLGLRNISVGTLVQPGDVITTIDDDRVMKLDFSVPSTFLSALKPGLEVIAKASGLDNQSFTGEVTAIASQIDPVTRSIEVRAHIPNPDRLLKPGLLMTVELLKNPRQALMIPEEALIPLGPKQFVLAVRGDTVERREIAIGMRQPGQVEILSGVQAGERVVTHGTLKVQPGQPIRIAPGEAE